MTDNEIVEKRKEVVWKLIQAWGMLKDVIEIFSECDSISPGRQTALVKFIFDIEPRLFYHIDFITRADQVVITKLVPESKNIRQLDVDAVKEYLQTLLPSNQKP
jgi:hypothetical protein